ncbi:MAG TPA: ATP-binding cassette domain-containing protein, partial [Nitrospirales bacterium]|nr:ATP-binding cassette domain-containing protein [Nitrospirales bacterium]
MSADDKKIIFSLVGVGRVHPPKKQVLKDIYLSFYYGAKIGVLGLNGSGKSTLLRIIAGIDTGYLGEVTMSKGYTVGLLEQEPHLDKGKTVKQVIEEGRQEVTSLLHEFEEVGNALCDEGLDPDALDKLIEKQGQLQEKIDAVDGWELENQLEVAMDALRCPP